MSKQKYQPPDGTINPQGTDKKRFMNKKNRIILLAAMIVAAVSQTFAQGNGLAGWRKRSIPTHSEWLYPLTFDAGKGLKEA